MIIDLTENLTLVLLTGDNKEQFFNENRWLNKELFEQIFALYEFPEKYITMVIEHYYIDAAYRDVYYNYWARFHFDWPRCCKRIFLFQNKHYENEFFDVDGNTDNYKKLEQDFLGTIVVRPAYVHNETEHTFGRTLLNPYKMVKKRENDGKKIHPFLYLVTTQYKVHLLEHTYTVFAFPFSSQDGVAMKCAETAIYSLCDYESTNSSLYAKILPSNIQEKLKSRVSERILPSRGLYCNDISFLLREFGFSPMIYAGIDDTEKAENGYSFMSDHDIRIGQIGEGDLAQDVEKDILAWDNIHETNYKDWFHYYVDSAIPILTITSPRQDVKKHATLVIGHGEQRKSLEKCTLFKLGDFPCIDTSELYEDYIVSDDNQIPYVEEKMDRFTLLKNYKLEAFIVPLERHVFLEASSAVKICDSFIEYQKRRLKEGIAALIAECRRMINREADVSKQEELHMLIEALKVSKYNPITIRYYLANSADYKQFRIRNGENKLDKKFYANILMPKLVWVAEISTYTCYEMGNALAELVLDATAASKSKVDGIILLRMLGNGVYRLPNESYDDFEKKLNDERETIDLTGLFAMYSNFKHSIWNLKNYEGDVS